MNLIRDKYRIYAEGENGRTVCEITYPKCDDKIVDINHTFVDKSLRGQGMADKLVLAAAQEIRKQGFKAHVSCSYARDWFEAHLEFSDILKK